MKTKESAKFFAGFAANQVLTHGAMAIAGVEFELFGIGYTRELNITAAVVWGILFLLLFQYAWLRSGGVGQR